MNKKIFQFVLLAALMIGALSTFSSCQKYDEDINRLEGEIAQNKAAIDQINQLIANGGVITAVKESGEGVKVTLSDGKSFVVKNGQPGKDAIVWTIGADGYWYKGNEKTDIKAVGTDGKDGVNGKDGAYYEPNVDGYFYKVMPDGTKTKSDIKWQGTLNGITAIETANEVIFSGVIGTDGKPTKVVISKSSNLRSLVFVPALYEDGVEAMRYVYADGIYRTTNAPLLDFNAARTTDKGAQYKFPAKSRWTWTNATGAAAAYNIPSWAVATYHLNPNNVNLNGIRWSLSADDKEFVDTRAAAGWTPVIKNCVKNSKDMLEVTFKVNNASKLKWPGTAGGVTASKHLSVMSLNAQYCKDGMDTTINSDYSALLPVVRTLKALAFSKSYSTDEPTSCTLPSDTKKRELYVDGQGAAENVPSIKWAYNQGPLDLNNILNVHYVENDFVPAPAGTLPHKTMAVKELKESYGLEFKYELIGYYVGETNQTKESQYGVIKGSEFHPAYVDDLGNSIICPKADPAHPSTTGISSVGRAPIVLATLVDEAGNVVLEGFFKIEIVAEEVAVEDKALLIDTFKVPYICNAEAKITWAQTSRLIYEELGLTKEQFTTRYHAELIASPSTPAVPGDFVTYEKDAAGKFVKSLDKWGVMSEVLDTENPADPSSTNHVIKWNGRNKAEIEKVYAEKGHKKELYLKYIGASNNIYIGLTVEVLPRPQVTFVEKILSYWYPTNKALAERDTVRLNVPRPTVAGITDPSGEDGIYHYYKNLLDNYVGNKVSFNYNLASDKTLYEAAGLKADHSGTIPWGYGFRFAKEQKKIGKYNITVSADQTQLLADGVVIAQLAYGTADPVNGLVLDQVQYQNNPTAQDVLNLYGHTDPRCFAQVELYATYGACDIPLGSEMFKVRFLRPIDVLKNKNAHFIDAVAEGSRVALGDLFALKDWREKELLTKTGTPAAYTSVKENGCDLYAYYDIKNAIVDLSKVQCDLTGERKLLSSVTSALELEVEADAGSGLTVTTTGSLRKCAINDVDNLNKFKVVYKNNGGNVQTFHLYIPVTIEYSWGKVVTEVEALVESTIANN